MINPVSIETYGRSSVFKAERRLKNQDVSKKISVINSAGISTALGALTTAVARTYTTNWKNAGLIGLGAAIASFVIVTPHLLKKNKIDIR